MTLGVWGAGAPQGHAGGVGGGSPQGLLPPTFGCYWICRRDLEYARTRSVGISGRAVQDSHGPSREHFGSPRPSAGTSGNSPGRASVKFTRPRIKFRRTLAKHIRAPVEHVHTQGRAAAVEQDVSTKAQALKMDAFAGLGQNYPCPVLGPWSKHPAARPWIWRYPGLASHRR